jgi:hypothetical protein
MHEFAYLLAHVADFGVGWVLSLELFCNLGICFLLFGGQLFDTRLWGPCSPKSVADDGPGRKRYRCPNVRSLRELPVCNCDPARGERDPALIRKHKATGFDDFYEA